MQNSLFMHNFVLLRYADVFADLFISQIIIKIVILIIDSAKVVIKQNTVSW